MYGEQFLGLSNRGHDVQNTQPLTDYMNKVRRFAEARTGAPVYNASLEHAVVILQTMFSRAEDSICILTGGLNTEAYGHDEVVKEARGFLESPEHRVRILFEDDRLLNEEYVSKHPFLAIKTGQKQIQKRRVPKELQPNYKFHFVVVDSDFYRFEPDREKYEAVAAFGDVEGGQNLRELFENLWEVTA